MSNIISDTLKATGNNVELAARKLDVSADELRRWMFALGIPEVRTMKGVGDAIAPGLSEGRSAGREGRYGNDGPLGAG